MLAYEAEIRGAKEAEECALYNSTDNNTTDQKKNVEKPQEKRERRRGQKTLADFENSNESSTYFAKLPMTEVLDARNNLVPRSELNLIFFVCFFVQKTPLRFTLAFKVSNFFLLHGSTRCSFSFFLGFCSLLEFFLQIDDS